MLSRLSYANVVATLALFVALGGSSYAALKLPRNSVGAKQIRSGAVQPRHLSSALRSSLGGGGGGGKVFFAHVGEGGKADDSEPPPGTVTVHQDSDHIGVQTYDANGAPANEPFNVIMAC